MKLNILTSKAGTEASLPYKLQTEQDFWKIYIRLLDTVGIKIPVREEEILTFILAGEIGKDYFTTPYSRELKEGTNISRSEITRFKQSLKAKGLINQDNLPVSSLAKLQKFIRTNPSVEFTFPLQIGI